MPYGEKFFKRKPSNTEAYHTIAEPTTRLTSVVQDVQSLHEGYRIDRI